MTPSSDQDRCDKVDEVSLYALQALSPPESEAMELHIASCGICQHELRTFRPLADALAAWPTRPPESLWDQLVTRIGQPSDSGTSGATASRWVEPEWEQVTEGIACKLLSTDAERDRVSMLVRLAPGVDYPPHRHAGVEELYLLHGELWIDDRKLLPGDYSHAEPGTADKRVWSETGCVCLLITSPSDVLS